jgi:2-oxoglutarate dehydrogenase E2 component (dihydrolipoamide succinyltransferase)
MAEIEIRLPKMGESVTEATITNWLKKPGDLIAMDEPLVEVATDKVDNELPSEVAGTLIKCFFEKDQVAQVGDVIAIISTDGPSENAANTVAKDSIPEITPSNTAATSPIVETIVAPSNNEAKDINTPQGQSKFFSPLVKSIAQKEAVSLEQLNTITGTGQDGRVTKKDILAFLENKSATPVVTASPVASPAPAIPETKIVAPLAIASGEDQIIEMDRMRKLIADHMVMSKHVSPHVTSFVEADVTNIVNWRNKVKGKFFDTYGENITFTPIFIEAIVKAIKDFPMINVSVNGTTIIKKSAINIGMATALPSGNLIVPVIKNADRLNLLGLTKAVNELANNARNNKLKPDDTSGGTYTMTNVGSFGNVMGTPIINQPQVAIMAVGAIRKMPAVIETPQGDFIGIRHKMFLSHSYDHRVVDGALGGQFVRRVADYLESFDISQKY